MGSPLPELRRTAVKRRSEPPRLTRRRVWVSDTPGNLRRRSARRRSAERRRDEPHGGGRGGPPLHRRRAVGVPGAVVGERHLLPTGRPPAHGRRRQGRDDQARRVGGEPTGLPGDGFQAAFHRGARPRLPVVLQQGASRTGPVREQFPAPTGRPANAGHWRPGRCTVWIPGGRRMVSPWRLALWVGPASRSAHSASAP